jgi:hypothetical protein
MKPRTIQQFAGEYGKHVNPRGEDCPGRSFTAKYVGVGGAYMNTVVCTFCQKELLASEEALLPESSTANFRKPTISESVSPSEALKDDYRLQCGRIIQTVREVSPACVVIFDKTCAPERVRFEIKDGSTTLTKVNPEFPVSEIADWPPKKLRLAIEAITDGLVKKSA